MQLPALAHALYDAYNMTMSGHHEPSRYARRIAVVDGLRRAFEKFKHHRDFSGRVKSFIESELPGYTVSVACERGPGTPGHSSVRIWGNGIDYTDSVYLSWGGLLPWPEAFAYAIDVADMRDHEERARAEERLGATLDQMNAEIERLCEQAVAMIEALPIPSSATVRADSVYWRGPSAALSKRYPRLFRGP